MKFLDHNGIPMNSERRSDGADANPAELSHL